MRYYVQTIDVVFVRRYIAGTDEQILLPKTRCCGSRLLYWLQLVPINFFTNIDADFVLSRLVSTLKQRGLCAYQQ